MNRCAREGRRSSRVSGFPTGGYLQVMQERSDRELLEAYAERGSEDAFAELVRRHLDLTYAVACRMLRDAHAAEDVCQGVFLALAGEAGRLRNHPHLVGWLHRTTRNLATHWLRGSIRRHAREGAVRGLAEGGADPGAEPWEHLVPHLDDALDALPDADRALLQGRYLQRRTARSLAADLGISEVAAQKRVQRAVERLRNQLAGAGYLAAEAGVVLALAASLNEAAPLRLAVSICSSRPATSPVPPGGSLTSSTGSLGFALSSKFALSLALLLVLGWAVWEAGERMWFPRRAAVQISVGPGRPAADTVGVPPAPSAEEDTGTGRSWKASRGLAGVQFRRFQGGGSSASDASEVTAGAQPDTTAFSAAMTNRVSPGHTLVVGGWSGEGMRGYLLITPLLAGEGADGAVALRSRVIRAPEQAWEAIGWAAARSDLRRSSLSVVLDAAQESDLLAWVGGTPDSEVSNESTATNALGRPMGFAFSVEDGTGQRGGVLVGIDLVPRRSADGGALDLELRPGAVEPELLHTSLRQAEEPADLPTP